MYELDEQVNRRLIARMARIEGQARGIQRMIEEGRDCREIVTQLAAMRAAISRVAFGLIAGNLQQCLVKADPAEREDLLAELEAAMTRL